MLVVDRIRAGYDAIEVLHEVSLKVERGECVALLGPNGAGKTTLLMVISGIVKAKSGHIFLDGVDTSELSPDKIVEAGIIQSPEGRQLFADMTVLENLLCGALNSRAKGERNKSLIKVFELFPRLAERRHQIAGRLSGGEQQMLTIGRAFMARPSVLLLDEPSRGLAPLLTKTVFTSLSHLCDEGGAIVVVEQNVRVALSFADRAYVLENGHIALEGQSQELLADDRVKKSYLGM